MNTQRLSALALLASVLQASAPLLAHHFAASYDRRKELTLSGTVTDFLFGNPHTQVRFLVKDEVDRVVDGGRGCES